MEEDEEEGERFSSSPPARRAILLTWDHFWRASNLVRLRSFGGVVSEDWERGVVSSRY